MLPSIVVAPVSWELDVDIAREVRGALVCPVGRAFEFMDLARLRTPRSCTHTSDPVQDILVAQNVKKRENGCPDMFGVYYD